ncbi:MAG: hypothetical protein K2O66_03060 [Bacteroidales bacterium]|nr:hypothetical protein [Bacteroidales bacterium]MDE7072331.1 hypothetical protein [Bacteroidales bacterium]
MTQKQYHAYISLPQADFDTAVEGLVDRIENLCREGRQVFKVQCFFRQLPRSLAHAQKHIAGAIHQRMPEKVPAIGLAVQAPLADALCCAEIWSVASSASCRFDTWQGLPFVEIERNGISELWSSGLNADYRPAQNGIHPVQEAAVNCFEQVSSLLKHKGYSFDSLFRQWNYIGHILDLSSAEGKILQNYQIFNDIRAVYYQNKQDRSQYPAATGIGMNYPGICIDFVAVKTDAACGNLAMKSPVQKDAYRYQSRSLVGESLFDTPSGGEEAKKAPLFERGRYLKNGNTAVFAMVSGTASIRGEETVDQNNLEQQTRNTLGFIDELVREADLHEVLSFCRARMYVKPGQPGKKANGIFTAHYPAGCVCTAVEAHICRNDLLMEIEADLM